MLVQDGAHGGLRVDWGHVRALLVRPDGQRVVLAAYCPGIGSPVVAAGLIAFACAREQAGEAVLHETLVVAADGTQRAAYSRCRAPQWLAPGRLRCQTEAVGLDGKLTTTPHDAVLPAPDGKGR